MYTSIKSHPVQRQQTDNEEISGKNIITSSQNGGSVTTELSEGHQIALSSEPP